MMRIRMRRGIINEVRITGHAGYAKKGSDIVCAAVSALIDALAAVTDGSVRDDGETYVCAFVGFGEAFDMARIGFARIAAAYPKHVGVEVL